MSIASEIERLNAIKDRIRMNLVAQGITVPADTMLDAMANQILSVAGEPGATFTPSVSSSGNIYWQNDKGLPNPSPVNIKGPSGDPGADGAPGPKGDPFTYDDFTSEQLASLKGATGPPGVAGEPGYTPVRGTDYWTSADVAEIKSYVDNAILGGSW